MPEPNAGDTVAVTTDKETVEGTLLPRSDMLSQDTIILKLKNGYNIGIERQKIAQIKVLKKYEKPKQQAVASKTNKSLPTIAILSTGGTISSKVDYRTGGVYADYTAEDFVQMCPAIATFANIKAKKIMGVMSEDMNISHWRQIADAVAAELNDISIHGVIVTQGTDTLHYTTAVLSFFLRNLNKPVIFTASQRSIDRGSSDAFMNLQCAVAAAAKFDGAVVASCMHATTEDTYCYLIRGTKVRKMHTSRRDAFRPINEFPLAKVFEDGKLEISNTNYPSCSESKVEVDSAFEEKTALVFVYPHMDPEVIDFYLQKGYKGIVLAATALGHVPTTEAKFSLFPYLEKCKKKNIPVVVASQTIYGRVHPYVYTNLRKLSMGEDVIFVEDMLPEVAFIKLAWLLGHGYDKDKIKEEMQKSIAGEISHTIDEGTFLL